MSLFARAGFEAFIATLPAARIVHQWRDDSVAKLGPRVFALLDAGGGEIWFKASEMSFALLSELDGVRPAPYFARAGWVAVAPDAPIEEEALRAYLGEAHRLVASRLTRKLRSELGLALAP
ncbi:MmcQ/YjbR family DNA-binding protein [Arsenicitalea aurantiaca]|uniref:MmcQ/YjbR family DNA-binding protein n=1 Tax=Arsenicitalea aurantiaca TaxID=1783274 RepID=A0A433X2M8_9HYPH|nr:MmcQ/YjbR family DNA-binding protein [Arsenicitalea aurantiaca]RUT28338.1 MmcQ/YjbR family DNA-binding protein [Arsenicitalea aurantiaca]